MQFNNYKSSLSRSYGELRGGKTSREDFYDSVHRYALSMDPEMRSVMAKICVQEWDWFRKVRRTVFVDSKTLPEMLVRIPVVGDIRPLLARWTGPHAFSFRNDARIGDTEIPGVLFSYWPADMRHDLLKEYVGRYAPANVRIEFAHLDRRDAVQFSSCMMPYSFHTTVPADSLAEIVEDPDWFDNHRLNSTLLDLDATETERNVQSMIIRVCLGLIVYTAAFPQSLRIGLPIGVKQRDLGKVAILKGATHRTLVGPSKLPGEKDTHFRSGHFRILSHERFHRDDHGNVRVVAVRSTIVKGKIDTRTIDEQENDRHETGR